MGIAWTGTLDKMRVEAGATDDDCARYALVDGWYQAHSRAPDFALNDLLGHGIELRFTGQVNCLACGRSIRRTYGEGYCFPCSQALAAADICMVRPELCHYFDSAHPCREETFARSQCFQPHYLYCALTSAPKIGITRQHHVPTRWLDQGATAAMPLALLPSRREVGLVEKRLREAGFADRTHWARMLRADLPDVAALLAMAQQVVTQLETWAVGGILAAEQRRLRRFRYPVHSWPRAAVSLDLGRQPVVSGVLRGIKGQYLLFDSGAINLRKHGGFRVVLSV